MRLFLALSLVLAAAPTFAQDRLGAFVGAGVDFLDFKTGVYRIDFDGTALSLKLTTGFRFNDNISFEAYFSRSEEFSFGESGNMLPFTSPAGPIGGDVTARLTGQHETREMRVVARGPHVLAGVGYFKGKFSGTVNGTSSSYGPFSGPTSASESGMSYILGAKWDPLDRVTIRAEFEYFEMENPLSAQTLGVMFQYGFGD